MSQAARSWTGLPSRRKGDDEQAQPFRQAKRLSFPPLGSFPDGTGTPVWTFDRKQADAGHADSRNRELHCTTHDLASGKDVIMESERTRFLPRTLTRTLTRRAALGGVVAGGLASLLVAIGQETGLAGATPAAGPLQTRPNAFALQAEGVEISYSTSSFTGEPTFSFSHELEGLEVAATGDDIHVQTAQGIPGWSLGRLVSVYVDAAPDAWARSLTLVLPDINLVDQGETPFTTFAMLTRHLTNIGGPAFVQGQFQEYDLIPLHGVASAVVF